MKNSPISPITKANPLCVDGFVHLLMSFGGIGKGGGGSNMRWWWCKSPDLGKREMLIKTQELTHFPLLKSYSHACGQVCAFVGVFGGIAKGNVGQM